jgi:hypothetical protein
MQAALVLLLIIEVGGLLRFRAMVQQPLDYDEQVYIPVAREYADIMRAGDWSAFLRYQGNIEHPAFAKVAYAGMLILNQALGEPLTERTAARLPSTLAGILLVAVLALVNCERLFARGAWD